MKIYIGKVIKTHGLDGKVDILYDCNNFLLNKYKDIYIQNKIYTINYYQKHNKYYLLKLTDINNIDEAKLLIGSSIYIDKLDNDFLSREELLIKYVLVNEEKIKVKEILVSSLYDILKLENNILIPYNDVFIKEIKEDIIFLREDIKL